MAAEKTITHSAEIVAVPFGMPRVEMPLDAAMDDLGCIRFVLNTAAGPVYVKAYWYVLECRGGAAALIAAGLTRAEWFPGLPGNQKTRQQVIFGSTGPRLLPGGSKGKKQTQPHITVCRYSSRTFSVEVPATPDQCERIEISFNQLQAREEKKRQAAYGKSIEEERIAEWNSKTQEDVRAELAQMASLLGRLLSIRLLDSRFRYVEEVMTEVDRHLGAARQALLIGKMLPRLSQNKRAGNVVYLPGAD